MEEKQECEIVKDLLLNYIDETLSSTSTKFVKDHLEKCEECKKILEDMKQDLEETEKDKEEKNVDYLKNVRRKINKKNICIIIIGVILSTILCINAIVLINYNKLAGNMEIYLNDDITEEELNSIKNAILHLDKNAKILYISKEDKWKDLEEQFKDNKKAIEGVKIDILPASNKIETKLQYINEIEERISEINGIKVIKTNKDLNPYELLMEKILNNK